MSQGGTLRIKARNVTRRGDSDGPEALLKGEYVAISLSDSGSGMPEPVLAKAFEPFFTTKGVGKGSGLGLSQAYGFARQSGRTITIESAVGRGTTREEEHTSEPQS